jgi:hypothetical protein
VAVGRPVTVDANLARRAGVVARFPSRRQA